MVDASFVVILQLKSSSNALIMRFILKWTSCIDRRPNRTRARGPRPRRRHSCTSCSGCGAPHRTRWKSTAPPRLAGSRRRPTAAAHSTLSGRRSLRPDRSSVVAAADPPCPRRRAFGDRASGSAGAVVAAAASKFKLVWLEPFKCIRDRSCEKNWIDRAWIDRARSRSCDRLFFYRMEKK